MRQGVWIFPRLARRCPGAGASRKERMSEDIRSIVNDVILNFKAQEEWLASVDPAFLTSLDVFAKGHLEGLSGREVFRMGVIIGAVYEKRKEQHGKRPIHLSSREHDVLNLMISGYSNQQISDALGIKLQTTKNHVSIILAKLGAKSRTEAVVLSFKTKLE